MDILDYAGAIEEALLAYHANVEDGDDENLLRYTHFTTYLIVEMSKRWAERRYIFKRTGKEVTIEECVAKSMEATQKHFRAQERKAAPAKLAQTMSDADELFAFLEHEPKPKDEPAEKQDGGADQEEPKEAPPEVPEPAEEPPEPVAANAPSATQFGGAAADPGGPEHYSTISAEEFAKIPPR